MHDEDDQPTVPAASVPPPHPPGAGRDQSSAIELSASSGDRPPPAGDGSSWSNPAGVAPYQPVPPTLDARTNGFAVAALVLGLVWVLWIGSVLAVIFGHVALAQIRESSGWQRGRGLAIAGLLLGYLALALFGFSIVLSVVNG